MATLFVGRCKRLIRVIPDYGYELNANPGTFQLNLILQQLAKSIAQVLKTL